MTESRIGTVQRVRLEPAQQLELENIQRRHFLRAGLTVGAMSMLTGCNLQDGDQVDKVLWAMSRCRPSTAIRCGFEYPPNWASKTPSMLSRFS